MRWWGNVGYTHAESHAEVRLLTRVMSDLCDSVGRSIEGSSKRLAGRGGLGEVGWEKKYLE